MKVFKMKYRKKEKNNKEKISMFLVDSQSHVHLDFACPFLACPIRCASTIAHPKN